MPSHVELSSVTLKRMPALPGRTPRLLMHTLRLLTRTLRLPGRTRRLVVALISLALISLWLLAATASAQRSPTYTNPVVAGDFPDPSVIRVGDEYWMTTTSGTWAPHFPILRSRDLVNWQMAGYVFERRPAWTRSDVWAPELIEDRGRFLVY